MLRKLKISTGIYSPEDFFEAVSDGDINFVKKYVAHGKSKQDNAEAFVININKALAIALFSLQKEVAIYLIENNADINSHRVYDYISKRLYYDIGSKRNNYDAYDAAIKLALALGADPNNLLQYAANIRDDYDGIFFTMAKLALVH